MHPLARMNNVLMAVLLPALVSAALLEGISSLDSTQRSPYATPEETDSPPVVVPGPNGAKLGGPSGAFKGPFDGILKFLGFPSSTSQSGSGTESKIVDTEQHSSKSGGSNFISRIGNLISSLFKWDHGNNYYNNPKSASEISGTKQVPVSSNKDDKIAVGTQPVPTMNNIETNPVSVTESVLVTSNKDGNSALGTEQVPVTSNKEDKLAAETQVDPKGTKNKIDNTASEPSDPQLGAGMYSTDHEKAPETQLISGINNHERDPVENDFNEYIN